MKRFLTATFLKAFLYYITRKNKKDPIFIFDLESYGYSFKVNVLDSNKHIMLSK